MGIAFSARSAPAGGENPLGFHPFLPKDQRHGRQITPLWRLCFPFGGAMPP
ncbi:MAG: hypothetical protein LBK61_05920 [Spirochaetaceae bacterium]|nr:hypothetical protein [Spirochaetaceae bacterium]